MTFGTTYEFGKTIGWEFLAAGFLGNIPGDSSGIILNEAAVKIYGLEDPIGESSPGTSPIRLLD